MWVESSFGFEHAFTCDCESKLKIEVLEFYIQSVLHDRILIYPCKIELLVARNSHSSSILIKKDVEDILQMTKLQQIDFTDFRT